MADSFGTPCCRPLLLPLCDACLCRSPIKAKKHVVMDVCQSDGIIARSTVSKASTWKVPTLYSAVRKLRWGGLVPVLPMDAEADLTVQDEAQHSDAVSVALTSSPFGRASAASLRTKEVRRDLVPARKEKRQVWGEGEGPPSRMDRNRLYRGEGEELYDYVDSDEERMEAEDETLNDPEFMASMRELEGVNEKVKWLERIEELQQRHRQGDLLQPDEIEELQKANMEKQQRLARGEEVGACRLSLRLNCYNGCTANAD